MSRILIYRTITAEQHAQEKAEGKRWCSGECKAYRPSDMFGGKTPRCRDCAKKRCEQRKQHTATWRREKKDTIRARQLAYRRAHPECSYETHIKDRYGVDLNWYNAKLAEQAGHCALCSAVVCNSRSHRLQVDHLHSHCTEKRGCPDCVRGLLCSTCNYLVGLVENQWEWVIAARRYVKSYDRAHSDRIRDTRT